MKQKIVAMMVALAASLGAIETWEDPATGYTWRYRIDGETAEITSDKLDDTVAILPPPTGVLEIPSMLGGRTVSGIGMLAFAGCTNITGVTIPFGVTSIDAAAFYWCSGLESVTIPPSVTNIGYNAFYGCSELRRVVAPAALRQQIESRSVFNECRADLEISYEPAVANVSAALDGGKANISFWLAGDVTAGCPDWNMPFLSVTATDLMTGATYIATPETLSGDTGTDSGAHVVTWDMRAQGIELSGNVSFTVSYLTMPLYCVIDLSGEGGTGNGEGGTGNGEGGTGNSYAVTYLDAPPEGGFNTDLYKTTHLAMRLIAPGTFMMGGSTETEISNAFYCAIFETTQRQWELVKGDRPSNFNNDLYYATRPVEKVSWNMIRGDSDTYDWPTTNAVDATSFVGVLRLKSGLSNLDLPAEAQWEYACRAGTTTKYNNGSDDESSLDLLGRYRYNGGMIDDFTSPARDCETNHGTAAVGSYNPNAWGLYDMHGNLWEWCLDRVDSPRAQRGGAYSSNADSSTSSYRSYVNPSARGRNVGLRLVRTLSTNIESERRVEVATGAERAGTVCAGSTPPLLVSYFDPVGGTDLICENCTFYTGQTTLTSGWYVVKGAVTNGTRITVSGDVNLILMDGAELTANGGVNVDWNNSLAIWAQSTNAVAGKLTARGGDYQAGIGGGKNGAGGTVTINGGKVEAHGGHQGAGIGGGLLGTGGTITVNGGTVEAYGGLYAAGIGGGECGAGGTVTISGGKVEAHGNEHGAGIGGGFHGAGGTVTISGGMVTATGNDSDLGGAGIGGGDEADGGTVTISGGTVMVTGGDSGAGIGGGANGGAGGTVIICGGTVTVTSIYGGAAIGGGEEATDHGYLSILGMAVYDADTSETPVAFDMRETVCHSSWAKVVPCDYSGDAQGHCPYCDFAHSAVGTYFKATLSELGYDVPTNGTAYSVTAYGFPAGLKLVSNKAVTRKVGKKTVVVKPAKSEWWVEGVPTVALDYFTNPPYLAITTNGVTETYDLPINVLAQEVTELDDLAFGETINEQFYLPGVTNGAWAVSGLPTGLKYTSKLLKKTTKKGKKVVSVTTNALPYSVYGKTTKAGLFTITAKKKAGAYNETMKYRVLVTPKAPDTAVFGDDLTNITTMAYVPVEWDLTGENGRARSPSGPQSGTDGEQSNVDGGRLGEAALPSVAAVGGKVAKVAGLPTGLAFAAATTYKDKKKKQLKQLGQTIVGTPTKPGTYVVTFTRNVKEKVKGKMKTVAKTAQILWKVVANDAELSLGFNTAGGVVESGVVGLEYGDLLAFTATSNATVKASGLPKGIALANLGDGQYAFKGFTAKAGTYLVTVTATLNGKTVTQRVALEVDGLPDWAKGTYNGIVTGTGGSRPVATNGLATITVSVVGKISGKFSENGTNWTLSAACYTDGRARSPSGPQSQASGSQISVDAGGSASRPYQEFICSNVVAKYTYKAKEKVKGKLKTVKKSLVREFAFTVSPVPVVPNVPDVPIRGFATLTETDATGRVPPEGATGGSRPLATEITAWQDLWGSTYKAVGKKLFTTKSGKKTLAYKTFTVDVYTNAVGAVTFIQKGDDVDKTGLTYFINLSLKVTTAGAVTATLTYDTGKKKKGKAVIYKPTCSTVVIPTSAADANPFTGEVPLYFAPSPTNNFPGMGEGVIVDIGH